MSELTLVLTLASLVDAEEEQDVEEEEDDESTDDAVDSLRGAGVGGIKAFLEVFFSATGDQCRGNISGDVPAKQGRPKTGGGGTYVAAERQKRPPSCLQTLSLFEHRALLEIAAGWGNEVAPVYLEDLSS